MFNTSELSGSLCAQILSTAGLCLRLISRILGCFCSSHFVFPPHPIKTHVTVKCTVWKAYIHLIYTYQANMQIWPTPCSPFPTTANQTGVLPVRLPLLGRQAARWTTKGLEAWPYGSFRHFICPGHSCQQTGTTELNSEILLNTAKDILNSPVHPHLIIFILNPRVPFPGSQQVSELPLPPFLASIITKKCILDEKIYIVQ